MALMNSQILYWCKTCDAGPFTINAKGSCSETIWNNHNNARHNIILYKKPEKSIEQLAIEFLFDHCDEWFHELIAYLKGPDKVCLLRDKSFEDMK